MSGLARWNTRSDSTCGELDVVSRRRAQVAVQSREACWSIATGRPVSRGERRSSYPVNHSCADTYVFTNLEVVCVSLVGTLLPTGTRSLALPKDGERSDCKFRDRP
jgi:hypothetical protein